MSGTPEETTGITRFTRSLKVDLKTGDANVWDRDIPRSFTVAWRMTRGATLATLATVAASAQGIGYMLFLSNEGATTGSVTIWEGTASALKFRSNLLAGDYLEIVNLMGPVAKWQGRKTLNTRFGAGGCYRVAVGLWYWAEEP